VGKLKSRVGKVKKNRCCRADPFLAHPLKKTCRRPPACHNFGCTSWFSKTVVSYAFQLKVCSKLMLAQDANVCANMHMTLTLSLCSHRDADALWWWFSSHLCNPPCLKLLLLAVEVADPLSPSPRPSHSHHRFLGKLRRWIAVAFLRISARYLPCTRASISRLKTAHWAECIRCPPPKTWTRG